MPVFCFHCVSCGHEYEHFVSFDGKSDRIECPACKSKVEQIKMIWKAMPATYMETIPDEGNELKR